MLFVALLGIVLISSTVVLHIAGTIVWLGLMRHRHGHRLVRSTESGEFQREVLRLIQIFFSTTVVILCLHFIEIGLWAMAYSWLPLQTEITDFTECVYFSMVTYTTLGYGDVVITDPHWRILAGIQAMGGMLVFGWSSALLFGAVQRVIQEVSGES